MNKATDTSTMTRYLERHQGLIWRIARAFSANADDRDDLAQEISIHLWACHDRLPDDVKESTYVYRVALNRAISWRRQHQTYKRHLLAFSRRAPRPHPPTPEETLQASSDLDRLYAAIHELSENDRTVILLSFEQTSYAEMAEVLGISEAAVGQRLSRARKRLAVIFEKGNP